MDPEIASLRVGYRRADREFAVDFLWNLKCCRFLFGVCDSTEFKGSGDK